VSGDVAAEAAADEVDAGQRLRVEKALEGAAERVQVVERGGLAGDNVVSFGAQRTQLPEGALVS
jgi:hypothetical protein